MKALHTVAVVLVVIGGLNWGLVGLGHFMGSEWDLVQMLVGTWSAQAADIVYILVGVSAIVMGVGHKNDCRECSSAAA